jgi:hypothetical protein
MKVKKDVEGLNMENFGKLLLLHYSQYKSQQYQTIISQMAKNYEALGRL